MPNYIHRFAGILAPLCLILFFMATVTVELMGSAATVSQIKAWIVNPGLWVMIPATILAGGSGMLIGNARKGRLVESKKKRMPFIAANGGLVLVPCAIFLNRWAQAGTFDTIFYLVQVVELIAGAINFSLMGLNVRDGLRMAGRLKLMPKSKGV